MDILNDVFKLVSTYFNTLSKLGYRKQADVDKLLVYSFVEEMLTGEMRYLITEKDYRKIEQALSCLYGSSCLLPYHQYLGDDFLFGHIEHRDIINHRITEDCNLRITEDDRVRFKAPGYNR